MMIHKVAGVLGRNKYSSEPHISNPRVTSAKEIKSSPKQKGIPVTVRPID